jgi:Zn-dependent alcohol dehydrogenase
LSDDASRTQEEGNPMKTRAVVCSGLHEPWKTEEVEIDPPANREVRVKMVYAGMCHSDEHPT